MLQAGGVSALQDVICTPFDPTEVGLAGGGGGMVDGVLQGKVERVDVWMTCLECCKLFSCCLFVSVFGFFLFV